MDRLTKAERSMVMSHIRSKWTKPELEFKAKHQAATRADFLPFKPDFLLNGKVIFIDSNFWHCLLPRQGYERMKRFWRDKLFANLVRDMSRDAFYKAVSE